MSASKLGELLALVGQNVSEVKNPHGELEELKNRFMSVLSELKERVPVIEAERFAKPLIVSENPTMDPNSVLEELQQTSAVIQEQVNSEVKDIAVDIKKLEIVQNKRKFDATSSNNEAILIQENPQKKPRIQR